MCACVPYMACVLVFHTCTWHVCLCSIHGMCACVLPYMACVLVFHKWCVCISGVCGFSCVHAAGLGNNLTYGNVGFWDTCFDFSCEYMLPG